MRILFLDQYGGLGGAQRCLLDLLPAAGARGWTARVGIPDDGPLAERVRALGVAVDGISTGPYRSTRKTLIDAGRFAWETPRLASRIGALVEAHSIGVLYVNGPRLLPAAAIAARARGLPLIFHCHVRLGQQAAIGVAGWALALGRASMIGCCEFAVTPLRRYVAADAVRVIYNGTADLARPKPHREGPPRIAVIGRVEPDKGQRDFVEAARILARRFPQLRFAIAGAPLFTGSTYLESVRRAAQGLPIEFQGWREDIAEVLAEVDILAVPSFPNEPSPRVIMEAFSARVPVVAFPSGGIPEILMDGETGFLTSGRGPEALAARMEDVLAMDPVERERVTDRARARWERDFMLKRFQDDIAGQIAQAGSRGRLGINR